MFIGNEDYEYDILNKISSYFKIPFYNIHVAESAKTGYSYFKNKEFTEGDSDLDIAIIDKDLFVKNVGIVNTVTNGLKNRSRFDYKKFNPYCSYIASGIFRPDLMPRCSKNKLSQDYYDLFKDINAWIYATQSIFENKQALSLKKLK